VSGVNYNVIYVNSNYRNIWHNSAAKFLCFGLFTKQWKFLLFWGCVPTPWTNWHEISCGQADPCAHWSCQISRESVRVTPVGQNADFWPVSKFNTDSLSLLVILPVINKLWTAFQSFQVAGQCVRRWRRSLYSICIPSFKFIEDIADFWSRC